MKIAPRWLKSYTIYLIIVLPLVLLDAKFVRPRVVQSLVSAVIIFGGMYFSTWFQWKGRK